VTFFTRVVAAAALLWMFFVSPAEARVFDFKNEHVAIYVGGTFGNSAAGDGAYALASGNGTKFDKKVESTASAEAGLLLSLEAVNFQLGVDYVMPRELKGVTGADSSGTPLFSLDSKLSALVVGGGIELIPYRKPRSRLLIGFKYGYSMANLTNRYSMTPAGTGAFGVGDYSEDATGTGVMLQGYAGWEINFTDVWTVAIHAGYRELRILGFKSTKETTAISGHQAEGQEILNMDGSSRAVNFGGAYVGLNFRFYL